MTFLPNSFLPGFLGLGIGFLCLQTTFAESKDVTSGRPVTFDPAPSYALTKDDNDSLDLTDGIDTDSAKGALWTQKAAVGWAYANPVTLTIDLGEKQTINGASLQTAAGASGVDWPQGLLFFASEDGKSWHFLGDLIPSTKSLPPSVGYEVKNYELKIPPVSARYVRWVVDPAGTYFMVDRLQVFAGQDSAGSLPGPVIADTKAFYWENRVRFRSFNRLSADLLALENRVQEGTLPDSQKITFLERIKELGQKLEWNSLELPEGNRSVMPLNTLHKEIFTAYGRLLQAEGKPKLSVIPANPWDDLSLFSLPAPGQNPELTLMRGEVRPVVANLLNTGEEPSDISVKITGLPDEIKATLSQTVWTDTYTGVPVATALPGLKDDKMTIPSGMASQLWVNLKAENVKPGSYRGTIQFASGEKEFGQIPIEVKVFDLALPSQPTLHIGGWDYQDRVEQYGANTQNREALTDLLRQYDFDTMWATPSTLNFGEFDAAGEMIKDPSTELFDQWIALRPDARRYAFFINPGDRIGDLPMGTPEFQNAVTQWLAFWVNHAKSKGLKPEQMLIHFVDEPHNKESFDKLLQWSVAAKAANTGIVLWNDPGFAPQFRDAYEIQDILCPHRPVLISGGKVQRDFYLDQKKKGRSLELYSCVGPSNQLDPYSYYRLQAWHVFDLGGIGSSFWAMCDNGGVSDWTPYVARRMAYTPFFLDKTTATPAKALEAIRAGTQDFEYLVKLRDSLAKLSKAQGSNAKLIAEGQKLLDTATAEVLQGFAPGDIYWNVSKPRDLADKLKNQIGQWLEQAKAVEKKSA